MGAAGCGCCGAGSVRVRRWPSEGRVGWVDAAAAAVTAALEMVALASLLELTAASFCSGTLMRFAADVEAVRPACEADVTVAGAEACVYVRSGL